MEALWNSFPFWGRFTLILVVLAGGYLLWMTARYHAVKKKILTMQEALNPGDVVLTQSGLYGVLTSLGRTTAHLRLTNGYEIVIDRFSIKEPATAEAAQEVQTVL